ncbi:peptide ABC transporter substrate-binding protein [Clostridium autoethanogenum]|uniref:Peptide ABC transporter substrate-binding protein n=1 Tax=Clostridium autoethanogenum TaxID=84023 RepID=A0A3M0S419_9CLOT|nr:peptide ABC transporter substrate-binding protein [Clostridium autoethanogenum]RMC93055.1 peptide ABC transporter substrate-binding protein [Clostridium autoethanogenum]
MKKFIYIILGMLIISIVSITLIGGSLQKKVEQTESSNYKNNVTYNLGKLPEDLIMLDSNNLREKDILANTFEGLVNCAENGKIVPALAESWDISQDGTNYTFKIRKDGKWSDGSDITANDFVNFFSDILNKNTNNIFSDQLNCIFGVEDYRKGKCDFNNVAITALNNKTLNIRLNYPCNYFLNILSQPIYALRNIDSKLIDWKKDYRSIMYSGSFCINNISDSGEITLKKNSHYWNKAQVKSNSITLSSLKTKESALAAFQSSTINVFTDPPLGELKTIEGKAKYKVSPLLQGEGIAFNLKRSGIANDNSFRKAVAASINRNNIVKNILNSTALESYSYIPQYTGDGLNGKYINKVFFQGNEDIKKASDMMKSVSSSYGEASLKLIYLDTVENKKTCEAIGESIKKAVGIDVKCEGYEASKFNEKLKKGDYDMAEIKYEGYYDYPLSFLDMWRSASQYNLYGYRNVQFDNKFMNAKFEKDGTKRIEILKEMENMLMEDMPIIPLYFNDVIISQKNYVQGIYTNKLGNIKLDKAYLDVH